MAFGWTYYLIAEGAISFLLAVPDPPVWVRLLVTAGTAGLLSLYGYYMGRSRWQEETLHATIPASLLRGPFISSIVSSKQAGHERTLSVIIPAHRNSWRQRG